MDRTSISSIIQTGQPNDENVEEERNSPFKIVDDSSDDDTSTTWSNDSIEIVEIIADQPRNRQASVVRIIPYEVRPIMVQESHDGDEKQDCLTVKEHVNIERVPKNKLPSTTGNVHHSIMQKEVQNSMPNSIRVSKVNSTELQPSTRGTKKRKWKDEYLTAQGHVTVNSGIKSNPSISETSSKDSSSGSTQLQNNVKRITVTHISPNEFDLSPIHNENAYKKNFDHQATQPHVTVSYASKEDVSTVSGNKYNSTTLNETQTLNYKNIRVSQVNPSEVESSPANNDTLKRAKDYSADQMHAIVTKGIKDYASQHSRIDNKSGDIKRLQQPSDEKAVVRHVNASAVPLSSIYKEEELKVKHDYLTANDHGTVGHAMKNELLTMSTNNYKPTLLIQSDDSCKIHVQITHLNAIQGNFQPSIHKSAKMHRNNNQEKNEGHNTAKIVTRIGSSTTPTTESNHNNVKEPQKISGNPVKVTHINPNDAQFSSICKEETQQNNREHLTRTEHAIVKGALKCDIEVSQPVANLTPKAERKQPLIDYTIVRHIRKNHVEPAPHMIMNNMETTSRQSSSKKSQFSDPTKVKNKIPSEISAGSNDIRLSIVCNIILEVYIS